MIILLVTTIENQVGLVNLVDIDENLQLCIMSQNSVRIVYGTSEFPFGVGLQSSLLCNPFFICFVRGQLNDIYLRWSFLALLFTDNSLLINQMRKEKKKKKKPMS